MKRVYQRQPFRGRNQLYFAGGSHSALGHLVAAGSGRGAKLDNWWNADKLKHPGDRYGLIMLLEGGAGFYSNETGFECSVQYGDFILEFPLFGKRYAPGHDEEWNELCVNFDGTLFRQMEEQGIFRRTRAVWHLADAGPWIARLEKLLKNPRPTSPLGETREVISFTEFLLEMIEAAQPKTAAPSESDWFNQACTQLTSDLSRPLDVRAIASNLGMSYDTFRQLFRRRCGLSPGQYFDVRRCEEAKRLLITQSPCWVIALYLGFCDEQYFARRFKKWTGMTPRQYRNQHSTQ